MKASPHIPSYHPTRTDLADLVLMVSTNHPITSFQPTLLLRAIEDSLVSVVQLGQLDLLVPVDPPEPLEMMVLR